jgi:hemerythrin-like domain-containing protein
VRRRSTPFNANTLSDNCLEVCLFIPFQEENMATTKQKDACDFLDADHKAVKKMFTEYTELAEARGGSREKKRQLAEKICQELLVHTQLEDEIFYPAVRKAIKEELMMEEAGVEHASAKKLIAEIQEMTPGNTLYDAKVTVLGEYIDHHVKEERNEMFPKARASKLDLVKMRDALQARKEELMADSEALAG